MKKTVTLIALLGLLLTHTARAQQPWIVGGSNAAEGQFPWIGDMRWSIGHVCGSSLIAPQWVLTAAHCCFDFDGNIQDTAAIHFRFNSVRTMGNLNPAGGVSRGASKIFIHPLFNESGLFTNGYDIALIKLSQPVTSITPIALPSLADTAIVYATGYPVKIAGWGLRDTTLSAPDVDTMKHCSTKVYDHNLCSAIMGNLTQRVFCAGYKTGEEKAGAAAGDSGGPVWVDEGGNKRITGLVSGGINPYTIADTPGVFTKVALFRPWIDSVMQANGTPTAINTPWDEDNIRIGTEHHTLHLYFGLIEARQVTCELYSIEGKRIYNTLMTQPSYRNYTLDLSSLSGSMYIVRIYDTGTGKYFSKKIIRN